MGSARHHAIMAAATYFLPRGADEADLSPWSSILPSHARVLRTNLFGDAFIADEAGAVHMLERGACSAALIASSEEEFWREVEDDAAGWQLRSLVEDCNRVGKQLGDGHCYAFTTLPVFGGEYDPENIWVAPWQEWFSLTADVFEQMKDLPDGAQVRLKIVD
jgi:Domain of unknown function (DUF1851)